MPMNEQEERFEQYLRQFRPVTPRAMAFPMRRPAPWKVFAAAAAMFVLVGVAVLRHNFSRVLPPGRPEGVTQMTLVQDTAMPRPVTIGELDAALRRSDHDFDQFLNDASPRMLPQQHGGTALYALSKE